MCDQRYNGWTNRETWLVNVWFNPEIQSDLDYAKDILEEMKEALPPVMKDFVDLGSINWHELSQSVLQDSDDYEEPDEEAA